MSFVSREAINLSVTEAYGVEVVTSLAHPVSAWLRCIVIFIVTFLIIGSNVINLTVLRITEQIPAISRFCLINLSCADFLVGVVSCAPSVVASALDGWPFGAIGCQISGINHSCSISVAVWSMSLISIDRYIAIVHPLRYHDLMTIDRCRICVALFWSIGLFTYMIPLMVKGNFVYYQYSSDEVMCGLYWEFRWFCILTSIYVPFLSGAILSVTNYKIIRVVTKMKKDEQDRTAYVKDKPAHCSGVSGAKSSADCSHQAPPYSLEGQSNDSTSCPSTEQRPTKQDDHGSAASKAEVSQVRSGKEHSSSSKQKSRDLKVVKVLGITAITYYVIFGPYVAGAVITSYVPSIHLPQLYRFVAIWMANSNSFLNVIIYSVMYSSFRKNAWRLIKMFFLCRWFGKKVNSIYPASDA